MYEVTTVDQGALISLKPEEIPAVLNILKNKGMSWDSLDTNQHILKLPQQYVGYIGLPSRRLIIRPKHHNITISHILRIYYFLYSAEYSDLDTPMYDVDTGNDINLAKMYVSELMDIVHRGIPVEYTECTEDLNFIRGNLHTVPSKMNMLLKKVNAFNCTYDDLTKNIPINKVLLAAAKKIDSCTKSADLTYAIRQFGNVDYSNYPSNAKTTRNTSYCKKAITLAYMILNDLTISTDGTTSYGESLLINFDKMFEDFVKKVLMEYSSVGNFCYWHESKVYGRTDNLDGDPQRSFLPDLLYCYNENFGRPKARAILDMKNKTSAPFSNQDVYQMSFYAQMLNCKKVILCYPSISSKKSCTLFFDDEKFYLQKLYATYVNLAGNSAREFKNNIKSFINNVENLL